MGDRVLDNCFACFDRLSMRTFLSAGKVAPHPELVEGRTALAPLALAPESLNVQEQDWRL